VRNPFWWGVIFALIFHLILGMFLGFYHPKQSDDFDASQTEITHLQKTVVKTPKPTPTPAPVPTPSVTTKNVTQITHPAMASRLKINVPHSNSNNANAPSEQAYVPPARGNENGAPGGVGDNGTGTGTAEPGAPTPTPACANPKVLAHVTKAYNEDYPTAAAEVGAYGTVLVQVTLSASGEVLDAVVAKTSGNRSLDLAAVDEAKRSEYEPDYIDCHAVGGTYIFRAIFEPN
jgi:TonB family protein